MYLKLLKKSNSKKSRNNCDLIGTKTANKTKKVLKLDLKFQYQGQVCDYSNAYMLVKRTITVANTASATAASSFQDKKVVFTNCAPFTSCITRINNT